MNTKITNIPLSHSPNIWVDQNCGIRTNQAIEAHVKRPVHVRALDLLKAICGELRYDCKALSKRFSAWRKKPTFPQFTDPHPLSTKINSKALLICFHGLNGQPSLWDEHIAYLHKMDPQIEALALKVPNAGHCSVNGPEIHMLADRVVQWTKDHPGKPVALFGQSNGTRFAVRLETWLRKQASTTPVHVALTGAVLYGTQNVNKVLKCIPIEKTARFTCGLFSPIICKELAVGSDAAKALLKDVREPLPPHVAPRSYVMYASLHETHVPNLGSSLPILNQKERQYILTNSGHNALATVLTKRLIDDCLNWMKGLGV